MTFAFSVIGMMNGCSDPTDSTDLGPQFDVGIYTGPGAFGESVKACFAAVRVAGFTCDTLTLNEISDVKMGRFAAILFAGGDAHFYSDAIGPVGRGHIRNYVADGGGYIGFGAGGAFAASDSGTWPGVGVIPGTTRYPSERIVSNPYYGIVEIRRAPSYRDVAKAETYQTLYQGGPEFFPTNAFGLTVDYLYGQVGTAAAVGNEYGLGNVWVAGFQPEIEEGNPRDSTSFGDDLADIDTEWDLIEAALQNVVTYANRN